MHCGEPRLTAVENAQIKWLDHSLYQREVFQSLYLVYFSALLFILSSLWSFLVSFRQHKHIISTFTQFKPFDHDQIILEVWSSKMSWSRSRFDVVTRKSHSLSYQITLNMDFCDEHLVTRTMCRFFEWNWTVFFAKVGQFEW